ncbi:divergent protein kinase domain 1C isoform X2 [Pectinophora gossypiella]|uniref:divergent protein kinase domain 1C isoform X2 n=1 Tax=Pectinophora gossypiella TaxID=13191 RepID=UPI00214F23A2|nr:divergent protein kinase domain 1C isoform X2 [Pectinophora gossypiella]
MIHYICIPWSYSKSYKPNSIMRGLRHQLLCRLTSSWIKYLKRRSTVGLFCIFLLLILMRWKLLCSNMQPLQHIQNVCNSYTSGNSVGNLCGDLCQASGVPSLSCHNFYQEKEAVFSGAWGNTSVVFKSAKRSNDGDLLYWLDASKKRIYPTEDDFSNMIKNQIKSKFNIVINEIDAHKMSYVVNSAKWPNRHTEMENVWSLMQDNEYLALVLYDKFAVFPKLVGSCGTLYAVQKLNSISGFWHLMTMYDSQEEWLKRIRIAILILDFLMHLESGLPEPVLICNVKMNHFGVTDDFKRIMYLDLDSVHPLSIANRMTGDSSQCKRHSDCDYLNCRSFCNLISRRCEHGVANNNLQIVCERIFLGWVMSGRVMVPGLLLGPRAPRVLVELLELCANPANERGTPRSPATKEIRKRLYDLLVHMTY